MRLLDGALFANAASTARLLRMRPHRADVSVAAR